MIWNKCRVVVSQVFWRHCQASTKSLSSLPISEKQLISSLTVDANRKQSTIEISEHRKQSFNEIERSLESRIAKRKTEKRKEQQTWWRHTWAAREVEEATGCSWLMKAGHWQVRETLSVANKKIYNIAINEKSSPKLFSVFSKDLENKNKKTPQSCFRVFCFWKLLFENIC